MRRQLANFVLAGGVAAGANWLSRLFLSRFMSLEYAVAGAYFVGMLIAYGLNRAFVFQRSGRLVRDELARFASVNLISLAQVWLVTVGLARFLFPALELNWHPEEIAHALGITSPILTSYFLHRYFTFLPAAALRNKHPEVDGDPS